MFELFLVLSDSKEMGASLHLFQICKFWSCQCLMSNLDFSQINCNTSRCFLRPEELDETRTRSSAYINMFTIVLPSLDPATFLISYFSRSLINRLNNKGLNVEVTII